MCQCKLCIRTSYYKSRIVSPKLSQAAFFRRLINRSPPLYEETPGATPWTVGTPRFIIISYWIFSFESDRTQRRKVMLQKGRLGCNDCRMVGTQGPKSAARLYNRVNKLELCPPISTSRKIQRAAEYSVSRRLNSPLPWKARITYQRRVPPWNS